MPPRKSFHRDLAFGQAGEELVIESFSRNGWKVEHRERTARYDFEMTHERDGDFLLVEVKTEPSALRWGNVFLEYECRGKPSGILASDSDVYVFIIGDRLLSCWRRELLELRGNGYKVKRGGDYDARLGQKVSLGHIIPVSDIEPLTSARDYIRRGRR